MVEFVDGQRFSGAEKHTVRLGSHFGIAKAHQPSHPDAIARQNICHGPRLTVGILKAPAQIQKAAAFGRCGQARLHGLPDGSQHGFVFAQGLRIQLRVAAGQIQPAYIFRQNRILHRAEKHKLRPGIPQCVQRFGIGKAERLVLCHRNADGCGCSCSRQSFRRRLFGQHGKALPIQHQCIGQQGDLFLQVGNFICSL